MQKTLVCILGPTAAGKTATAIQLARRLGTEIVSADSRQFYREISIGTAKPSEEELKEVPHHFIGHISVTQDYSAGDFERDALNRLDELFARYDVVVAVGGSGLYVKALTDGLDDRPPADEALRNELNAWYREKGIGALQQRLLELDQDAYAQTELLNPQRVMRAIEIASAGKKGFVPGRKKHPRRFRVIKVVITPPREILYDRINQRVDRMMEQGLEEEARSMMPNRDTYALQTVGYRELFGYFDGEYTLEKAVELVKQHTRNYAKRQLTWFRKEEPHNWFEPGDVNGIMQLLSYSGVYLG